MPGIIYTDSNPEKIDTLVTQLSIDKVGSLILAKCNSPPLQKEIINDLSRRLNEINISVYKVETNHKQKNLYRVIQNIVDSEEFFELKAKYENIALFVVELEKYDQEERVEFVKYLNFLRDKFYKIKQPIVIWVNEDILTRIAKDALDFWSWVSRVYEFEEEREIPEVSVEVSDWEIVSESSLESIPVYEGLINELRDSETKKPYQLAALLKALGRLYYLKGDAKKALELLSESLGILKELDNQKGLADILCCLGRLYHYLSGEHNEALEKYQAAMKLYGEIGDEQGKARVLNSIGGIYRIYGQFSKSWQVYLEAKEIFERIDDKHGLAWVLRGIATTHRLSGQLENGLEESKEARQIFEKIGDDRGKAYVTGDIGNSYRSMGLYEEALNEYKKAKETFERIGDEHGKAWQLLGIAQTHQILGQYKEALKEFHELSEVCAETGYKKLSTLVQVRTAEVLRLKGDYRDALSKYTKARQKAEEFGITIETAYALLGTAESKRMLEEPEMTWYEEAMEVFEKIESKWGIVHTLIGRALAQLKDWEKAKEDLERAEKLCSEMSFNSESSLIARIHQERNPKELHELNFP